VLGGVAFVLQFREQQPSLGFFGRLPAGESVGEINPNPFEAMRSAALLVALPAGSRRYIRKWHAEFLQKQAQLKVRNNERGRENLKAENAFLRRFFQVAGCEPVFSALFEGSVNAVEHLDEIRARAATGVEHVDVLIGEAER
jgi:hypothetical protein